MAKKKTASSIDVLSHSLVPKMEILSENERKRILKTFGIREHQLPKMLAIDPAVQAINAGAGDIVAIHREDVTGKYAVYKLVVSGTGK